MAQVRPATAVPRSYPIFVEVGYKLPHRGAVRTGRGLTESMSSTCIRFVAPDELPTDTPIDLSIEWPALLNEKVGLRLCVKGRIIERRGGWVAVAVIRYEFRTKASATVTQVEASSSVVVCIS